MIEIEGTPFTPDFRSKQHTLYKIIEQKDKQIKELQDTIANKDASLVELGEAYEQIRAELKAMKSKEYKRAKKRKAERAKATDADQD